MNLKKKILVVGSGGDVGIAIIKTIKELDKKIYVIGANSRKNSPCRFFSNVSLICPLSESSKFKNWLLKTIRKYKIDILISGVEEVNKSLSKIEEVRNITINFPQKIHKVFNSKYHTYQWLKENGLNFPKTIKVKKNSTYSYLSRKLGKTFIIKPEIGKASEGLIWVKNDNHFKFIKNENVSFVAQEIINFEHEEYTCAIFKSNFKYTKIIMLKRFLKNGSTVYAEVTKNKMIAKYCLDIAQAFPVNGSINVQLKLNKNKQPVCFEINPRFSGTTYIRHRFGFIDLQASLYETFFDINCIDLFKERKGKAIRYQHEEFF